jgi:hypothetical protein
VIERVRAIAAAAAAASPAVAASNIRRQGHSSARRVAGIGEIADEQGLTLVLISAQLELFCPPYNPT